MPALPNVPKVVRVDSHFQEATDPNVMVRMFLRYSGTLSLADATQWCQNIATASAAFWLANGQPTLTLVLTELTDLTSPTAPQVQNSTSQSGTSSAHPLAAGTAMVIKYKIARRYRGGHPRAYLPGMSGLWLQTPTLWAAASAAGVLTDWNTFLASSVNNATIPTAGTLDHVNISYYQGFTNHTYPSGRVKAIPTPRATPLVDAITGTAVNLTPASQRRRNEQP